ncbi:MAG: TonB-dependent receptor plug domain-containing protein, partial [Thiovulaceae bacterium]|nr:TonB-dependent receptor plug domain-containing protein [Sulfurimonadaceae bacterium]
MNKTLFLLAAIMAVTLSLSAANSYTLDDISVTAAQGTKLKKEDLPDSVIIITKEAIEEARVTTLDQALRRLGSLAASSNGGPGQPASLYIRGMDSKRTLVLIDGVRYNDVTGLNGAQYPQIALYNVEQIEIIKGAQSGIWGADASAGVINIVTSRAKKGVHGVANVEYGAFDTKVASLQASYATESFDVAMGGSYFATDGFSAVEPAKESPDYGQRYDDLGLEKDAYSNKAFNAKFGWNITDRDRIKASVQTINSYIEYDSIDFGTGQPADAPNGPYTVTTNKDRFYSLAYRHNGAVNDVNLQYNLSTFDRSQYGGYTGSVNEVKLDDKITYGEKEFLRVGGSYQKFEQKKSGGADL